jgi:hypothetical protein
VSLRRCPGFGDRAPHRAAVRSWSRLGLQTTATPTRATPGSSPDLQQPPIQFVPPSKARPRPVCRLRLRAGTPSRRKQDDRRVMNNADGDAEFAHRHLGIVAGNGRVMAPRRTKSPSVTVPPRARHTSGIFRVAAAAARCAERAVRSVHRFVPLSTRSGLSSTLMV